MSKNPPEESFVLDMSKGSMHRSWIVLGVMAKYGKDIRLMDIVEETAIPYPSLIDMIKKLKAGQIPGLVIEKTGNGDYGVRRWGKFASRAAVIHFYDNVMDQLAEYRVEYIKKNPKTKKVAGKKPAKK